MRVNDWTVLRMKVPLRGIIPSRYGRCGPPARYGPPASEERSRHGYLISQKGNFLSVPGLSGLKI